MAAQRLRLQTGAAGGDFENPADAVLVEPAAGELAMAVDPAKDGTGGDARRGEPVAEGADRAVGSSVPKGMPTLRPAASWSDFERRRSMTRPSWVRRGGQIRSRQLRAAEGAGEAEQNQRPVAEASRASRAEGNDPANVAGQKRGLAFLGGADRAAMPLRVSLTTK